MVISMPKWNSHRLGQFEYEASAIVTFPKGLAGFEMETSFVPIEKKGYEPVVFLQSLRSPELCFVTVPMNVVDSTYQLRIMTEDMVVISASEQYSVTEDLACLAIVCLPENGPATANLLGPVVVNCKNRVAVQAIRDDSKYSASHSLETRLLSDPTPEKEIPC